MFYNTVVQNTLIQIVYNKKIFITRDVLYKDIQ
jgi:hypothetical protein